jgi:hypothetical protein
VSPATAAWLSTVAKGAFLVNGIVTLPMYLRPYQVSACLRRMRGSGLQVDCV